MSTTLHVLPLSSRCRVSCPPSPMTSLVRVLKARGKASVGPRSCARPGEPTSILPPQTDYHARALGACRYFLLGFRLGECPAIAPSAGKNLCCNQESCFLARRQGRLHRIRQCLHRDRQLRRCLVCYRRPCSGREATEYPYAVRVPLYHSAWFVAFTRVSVTIIDRLRRSQVKFSTDLTGYAPAGPSLLYLDPDVR